MTSMPPRPTIVLFKTMRVVIARIALNLLTRSRQTSGHRPLRRSSTRPLVSVAICLRLRNLPSDVTILAASRSLLRGRSLGSTNASTQKNTHAPKMDAPVHSAQGKTWLATRHPGTKSCHYLSVHTVKRGCDAITCVGISSRSTHGRKNSQGEEGE